MAETPRPPDIFNLESSRQKTFSIAVVPTNPELFRISG